MRFKFNGETFIIEFRRHPGLIPDRPDLPLRVSTRYPSTTVFLSREREGGVREPYLTSTVGAYHKDRFTKEKGRLAALRVVSKSCSKAFRKALFDAYIGRKG
jgi:hypothetical protein